MRRHLYFYTHLGSAPAAPYELFRADPGAWLPRPAEQRSDGWAVRVLADGALPSPVAGHDALVQVGEVADHQETGLLRAISWRSATAQRAVPSLEADLELASLSGGGCRLSLMGSYRPPLSVVGDAGDWLLGHRVAEAVVRRFVLDIADRLEVATLPA